MATRKQRAPAKRAAKKRPTRKVASKKTSAKAAPKRRSAERTTKERAAKKTPRTRAAASKPAAAKPKAAVNRAVPPKAASAPRAETTRRAPASSAIDPSLFPCGEEALRAATGKGWNEWLAVLDAAGAQAGAFDHQRVWDLAMRSLPETAGWWGQMISVGYERVRGLREKHESCNGEFQSTLSKTFPVPLFAAFAAWADANLRGQWLEAPELSFTKLNAGRNIRARWPDGSLLDIRFNATGPDRCQIVVDTMKLNDGEAVQKAKAFWQAQFERLQHYLEG